MQKLTLVLIFLGSLLVNTLGSHAEIIQSDDQFFGRRRVSKLRIYLQDIIGGENKTVWEVAKSNLTDVLPSAFGIVYVLDNLVTSGPEIDSEEVGRLQGIVASSDLHEIALDMLINLVFTRGKYKGSTLSIFGRNPLNDEVREVSIVGGTGAFRMASGYIIITTYAVDEAGIRNVYVYNAVVLHMDHDDAAALVSHDD